MLASSTKHYMYQACHFYIVIITQHCGTILSNTLGYAYSDLPWFQEQRERDSRGSIEQLPSVTVTTLWTALTAPHKGTVDTNSGPVCVPQKRLSPSCANPVVVGQAELKLICINVLA